jgi:hypothetical protein
MRRQLTHERSVTTPWRALLRRLKTPGDRGERMHRLRARHQTQQA